MYIDLLQKELAFFHALVENKNCFVSAKVSVFHQDQTTITQEDPIVSTWHKY